MAGTKNDYINYRVAKSKETFEDAQLLTANGRWNSSVNRLYYSSFYLITALLYKIEAKSETHKGAKTQFNLHFIKSGILSKEFGKLYSNLFDWRQETDYVDFIEFDGQLVIPLIHQVDEFNKILKELILEKE